MQQVLLTLESLRGTHLQIVVGNHECGNFCEGNNSADLILEGYFLFKELLLILQTF
jgi:hypothetical protein